MTARSNPTDRCAILGGAGNMGRWFGRFLESKGYRISIIEQDDALDAVAAADLVVLATPLGSMRAVLGQVLELAPQGLVLEIASLKSPVQDLVLDGVGRGLQIASVHPMFGPDRTDLTGTNILVCRAGCDAAEDRALALFAGTGATVTAIPLAEHDRVMAWVLNLPHLVNLLMADVLQHSGRTLAELEPLGGITYARQLAAADEVMSENPDLYHQIQHLNRHRDALYAAVQDSLDRLAALGRQRSPDGFRTVMTAWRRFRERDDD